MKEIKAYVHRNRIADVISALKASTAWGAAGGGDHNLTAYMVEGLVVPLDDAEKRYSVDLGDEVIYEYKLELHCIDEFADELVGVIRRVAQTGQKNSGWIYVVEIARAVAVD